MNEFVNYFFELLDYTDKNLVTINTKFKDMEEWSSILVLSLIAMVDENYNLVLNTDDIRSADTLEDLYSIILKNK